MTCQPELVDATAFRAIISIGIIIIMNNNSENIASSQAVAYASLLHACPGAEQCTTKFNKLESNNIWSTQANDVITAQEFVIKRALEETKGRGVN